MTDVDPTRPEALAAAPDLTGTTVAVTGANGFVGARTCLLLAAAGARVRALVRGPGTAPSAAGVTEDLVTLDDEEAMVHAMRGADVVVHTAAAGGPDLELAAAVNVDGTRHVLASAGAAAVDRVVHVSTISVHDTDAVNGTIDEDAPLVDDDASPYAVTKRDAERVVAESDVPAIVLRPPAVIGWSPTSTWGQRVPAWVADGELPMTPHPHDGWSWVHVDDLAVAIARAAVAHESVLGRVHIVSSGDSDWGTYLGRVRAWSPDAPSPFGEAGEPTPRRVTSQRARTELGWAPTISLDEALDEVAAHHT